MRIFRELNQLLREGAPGSTLREAVDYFLANRHTSNVTPKPLEACIAAYIAEEEGRNVSGLHLTTLNRHLGHFKKKFAGRKIHDITTAEILAWFGENEWSPKTRINTRGSLVGLFLFSQKILKAIPHGDVAPALIRNPRKDASAPVEIYTPEQMRKILDGAETHDRELLPVIVPQAFQGLRPDEVHAENAERPPLDWEAFVWRDGTLHVVGQKVRSKATRDLTLHDATRAYLESIAATSGPLWRFARGAYNKKLGALCEKVGVPFIQNGFRHSYASYRIRLLNGNLDKLAEEMGNSPTEITRSYKRGVSDKDAADWFAARPNS